MLWDGEKNYDCREMVTSAVEFVVDCAKITPGKNILKYMFKGKYPSRNVLERRIMIVERW